jgi:hypothetical protein
MNRSKFESTNFDITSIRPYPKATAQWPDPPNLPKIQPFLNLGEVVDYVYRLVPKLQVHLTVLHKKIIEQETELRTKMDKLMIEKVLERFQGIIRDVGTRMDEMQAALLQTASREEINEMLDNALACAPSSGETAVGQMMCMACGRPISQVTGALTREEAHRLLGTPPNSMVFKSPGQNVIGLIGETRAGFDSKIVETPCSVRSSRPASRTAASPGD